MSRASLTFTLPDERHEFKAAANAGDLVSAVRDFDQTLRQRSKHGTPAERRLTAEQARELLRVALNEHDADWALD